MYKTYYRRHRRSGVVMPFLVIIVVALILVFGFQLWSYYAEHNKKLTENKAAVSIASGTADMMVWGEKEWSRVYDGTLLREGDSLRTGPAAKISLYLLNGSVIRVGADTEFMVDNLKTRDSQDALGILLKKGDIWLKRTRQEGVITEFQVATEDITVHSLGTVFAVSHGDDTAVRVMEGVVSVDIKSDENGKERVIETLEIGVGQEVVVGQRELALFKERRAPAVLYATSDGFRNGDWYRWNTEEDTRPSNVAAVKDAVKESIQREKDNADAPKKADVEKKLSAEEVIAEPVSMDDALSAPAVIEPGESNRIVKAGQQVVLRGTVAPATTKVEVTTYVAGKADPYILAKYVPGSMEWNYVLAEKYGNMVAGENRYSIAAYDKDGNKSAVTEVVITLDKPKEPADLSVPDVLSFNGVAENGSFETDADVVEVKGKIGKGVVKVVINGFELTRYAPDSEGWTYFAKTVYGNLKEGENPYVMYGIDADGNKTPEISFVIVKKAPAPAAPTGTPASTGQ